MAELIEADPAAEAGGQLARLKDIWDLLTRAERLGYSLVLSPEQAREIAGLLENTRLEKLAKRSPP